MTTVVEHLAPLAAAAGLVLAVLMALPRPRGSLHAPFALGALLVAAEAVATYLLLTRTETPEARGALIRVVAGTAALLPVPWLVFVTRLAHPGGRPPSRAWRVGLAVAFGLSVAAAGAALWPSAFRVADVPGPFEAVQLRGPGAFAVVVQLLTTAGVLAGLELCLRHSRGMTRWRIKHLVLGLGGLFLARFYVLSQMLLFQVVMASYLTVAAGAAAVGSLLAGISVARNRLLGVELTVSRQVLFRSVVVGVLGLYLVVLGALGWVLPALGVPEHLFWSALVVVASSLALGAVLLSENLRWRVQRFIALHFYRSKYDYRAEWVRFTSRLGSRVGVEELAPEILATVTEAVGATTGALYLADPLRPGAFRLAGAVGTDAAAPELPPGSPLLAVLERGERTTPDDLAPEGSPAVAPGPDQGMVVPLAWRGTLLGVMHLGRERAGSEYSVEDREFLATVGAQAAGALVTAQLSEAVARAREFEALHRLTSFVVHDLKNSISALSMLSRNALANFDDPEFQRDAIRTLSRTVERMRRLVGRLSPADGGALERQPVDLAALAQEASVPLALESRIRLVTDLGPAPPAWGDPDALVRVLENLLANARDAVRGEGQITVRTYGEDGWAVCAIADTGCGMSDAFLRTSLFAPFRSTKASGWGIGLYQARSTVEALGGRIDVASREGAGTTFWIRLPVVAAAAPPPAVSAAAAAGPGQGRR